MRDALEILLDDLLALKGEGVERVVASDETLAALRDAIARHCGDNGGGEESHHQPAAAPGDFPPPTRHHQPEMAKPASSRATISGGNNAEFPPAPKVEIPAAGTKAEKLATVRAQMLADPVCNKHLHAGKHLVFGEGNPDTAVLFCGEAPGAEEEDSGRPFVGAAGHLLDKIIVATGLSREQVYIGNIMKWRPETGSAFGNRPPTPQEMAYCLPYIEAQIAIISPRVIVALGATAARGLLGGEQEIGKIHGREFDFRGVPVIPTYHPAYLLRNNSMRAKRIVWEDFMVMMAKIGLPISEKQRGYFLPKI